MKEAIATYSFDNRKFNRVPGNFDSIQSHKLFLNLPRIDFSSIVIFLPETEHRIPKRNKVSYEFLNVQTAQGFFSTNEKVVFPPKTTYKFYGSSLAGTKYYYKSV